MRLRTREIGISSLVALAVAGCGAREPPPHLTIAGGDAETGRTLIQRYGCAACHTIEGIPGAIGIVGPPLRDFAQRNILAGSFPNVPRHLVPWLMNPPAMQPNTAMPNLGITAEEANHMATFLYTQGAENAEVFEPRPTEASYPWADAAAARVAADKDRLEGLRGAGPGRARIPIDRAMELLATTPELIGELAR